MNLDDLPSALEPGEVAELQVSLASVPPDAVPGTYTVNLIVSALSIGEAAGGCSPRLIPSDTRTSCTSFAAAPLVATTSAVTVPSATKSAQMSSSAKSSQASGA